MLFTCLDVCNHVSIACVSCSVSHCLKSHCETVVYTSNPGTEVVTKLYSLLSFFYVALVCLCVCF